jgi:septal ring factor EnvC (AmiA/AmiB activator)
LDQQRRIEIENLESTIEEDAKKVKALESDKKKLESDNKRLHDKIARAQSENEKLKKIITEKLSIIEQLKKAEALTKPDIIKVRPQSRRKEQNPIFAIRTISNEPQDDMEENPNFKVTCNKIMKKMSMKNIALKRSQESTQLINSTVYTRETSVSNKENMKLNSNKVVCTRNEAEDTFGRNSKF